MAKLALLMLALTYSAAANECQDCTEPANDETSLLQAHVKLHDRGPVAGETSQAAVDPEYVAQTAVKVADLQEAKVVQTSSPVEDATTGNSNAQKADAVEDPAPSTAGGKTTELTKKESGKTAELTKEESSEPVKKEDSKAKDEKEDSNATKKSPVSELKAASESKSSENELDAKLGLSSALGDGSGYVSYLIKTVSSYLLQGLLAGIFYFLYVWNHADEASIFPESGVFDVEKFSEADELMSKEAQCCGATPYSDYAIKGCLSAGAANIVLVFCCIPCIPMMAARTINIGYKPFKDWWGYPLGCCLMTCFAPCALPIFNAKFGEQLDGGLLIYRFKKQIQDAKQQASKTANQEEAATSESGATSEALVDPDETAARTSFYVIRALEAICCMPCAVAADAAKVDAMYGKKTGFFGIGKAAKKYDSSKGSYE